MRASREIARRLERLEQQRIGRARHRIVTMIVNHGEDEALIEAAWRREHPGEQADGFILWTVFGKPPRLEFATLESVLEVLPDVKSWPGTDVEAWREACEAAGVDWDTIQPSYHQHGRDAERPYRMSEA